MKMVTATEKVGRPQRCLVHFCVYTTGECPRCARTRLPSPRKEEASAEPLAQKTPRPFPPSL